MAFSQKIKDLIATAWGDNCPCLIGTVGPEGPNISPKGSVIVYDDNHLAYWERSKKKALENLQHDKRVVVLYSNMKAQRDGVLPSGVLRFYGSAELHESGPIRDAIFAKLAKREHHHHAAAHARPSCRAGRSRDASSAPWEPAAGWQSPN